MKTLFSSLRYFEMEIFFSSVVNSVTNIKSLSLCPWVGWSNFYSRSFHTHCAFLQLVCNRNIRSLRDWNLIEGLSYKSLGFMFASTNQYFCLDQLRLVSFAIKPFSLVKALHFSFFSSVGRSVNLRVMVLQQRSHWPCVECITLLPLK